MTLAVIDGIKLNCTKLVYFQEYHMKNVSTLLALAVTGAGLLASTNASAVAPSVQCVATASPTIVLNARPAVYTNVGTSSWSDPTLPAPYTNWENMPLIAKAQISLKAGQKVRFLIVAAAPGVHPGATVTWVNPLTTTVVFPAGQTVDQVGPQQQLGNDVVYCVAPGPVGKLVQIHRKAQYDADGMTNPLPDPAYAAANLTPAPTDYIPGMLQITYTATKDGIYEINAGGYNPNTGAPATSTFNIGVFTAF